MEPIPPSRGPSADPLPGDRQVGQGQPCVCPEREGPRDAGDAARAPGLLSASLPEALPPKGPRRPSSVLPRRVNPVRRPRSRPAARPPLSGPRPARPCRGCGPSLIAAGAPPRLGLGLGERRAARRRLLTVRRGAARVAAFVCKHSLPAARSLSLQTAPAGGGGAEAGRRRGGGGAEAGRVGPREGPREARGASRSAAFRAILAPGSPASFEGRLQSASPFFTAHRLLGTTS